MTRMRKMHTLGLSLLTATLAPSTWAYTSESEVPVNPLKEAYFGERGFVKENFVRYSLGRGIKYRQDLGVNPFKYGFVGGTDNRNGTPSNSSSGPSGTRSGRTSTGSRSPRAGTRKVK